MATLSSNLEAAKRAGIAIQVIDELLGTGDNSEADYDLDNDKVLASSYTLSYAAASGATNTFTALTETTHYTLDKDSGRVVLTSSGISTLGTNKLYASYWHLSDTSPLHDAIIETFRDRAEQRLREMTGRVWTSTTLTEYKDGTRKDTYPRTDLPFSLSKEYKDFLQLDEYPVVKVNEVFFLDRTNTTFDDVQTYDGSIYTDNTEEAEGGDGTTFYPFSSTSTQDNALYFGLSNRFLGVILNLQTLGTNAGSLAVTWEYWNGSAWTAITVTADTTNAEKFLASGKVTWDMPANWATTTVNSGDTLYYVRARISTNGFTVLPQAWEVYPDPDCIISVQVSPRSVQADSSGRIVFISESIPDGYRNVRIKYTAGVASTYKDYKLGEDMVALIAGLMCVVAVTGGSYDDETRFEIGSKAATIGEVYPNVREVIQQIKDEIKETKRLLGGRIDIAGGRLNG